MRSNILRGALLATFVLIYLVPRVWAHSPTGIPVLLYHHVGGDASDHSGLTLSTIEFERQMKLIHMNGYQTISLEMFLAYMKRETVKLPGKPVLITFDDGYADTYGNAFPILKRNGFIATVFMTGINFDRNYRLSVQNVREMTAYGFAVGGHSMTHPNLTKVDKATLHFEIAEGKTKNSKVSGAAVDFFAYPGGFYNLATVEAVEAAGYHGAFTVLTGLNNPDRDHVYLLRRIPVFSYTDFDKLLFALKDNSSTSIFWRMELSD